MFRSLSDALAAAAIVLVLAALLVVALPRRGCADTYWPRGVPRWMRAASWYEVKHDGQTLYSVARYLLPEGNGQDKWLYAQELAAIRGVPAATKLRRGALVRIGHYKLYHGPRSRYATVDMRTWHLCVMAGMRYGVRPSVLVGIRLHEGGNRLRAYSPWGCKPHGSYTLRQEAFLAARIVARHARHVGWDAWRPRAHDLVSLGGYYTTGCWGTTNAGWARNVKAIMDRAEGGQ